MKRLNNVIRDHDSIQAVVLNIDFNSNEYTTDIASLSVTFQALAIQAAYVYADIIDLNLMIYLECHKTRTQADDSTEVQRMNSVFAATRSINKSLIIDSIKNNINYSKSAADNFALLKIVLFIENDIISDNSTFINFNSKIDFVENKVKVFKNAIS